VTYNFGLAPSFNVSSPEGSSSADVFSSKPTKNSCSFRDILSNTAKDRSRNEIKADVVKTGKVKAEKIKTDAVKEEEVITDPVTDTEKELVSKSESKLKSNSSKNLGSAEEPEEKQEGKEAAVIEELLSKLEELVDMQNSENMTGDKQMLLLDDINKILKELTEIQAGNTSNIGQEALKLQIRAKELMSVLEAGGISDIEETQDLLKELKAMASEAPVKSGNYAPERLEGKKESSPEKPEENQTKDAPVKSKDDPKVAEEKQKPAVRAEAHNSLPSEEGKTEAVPEGENIKAALDGKVEKVTVEAKSDKEQGQEKEGRQEAAEGNYKAVNVHYDKPDAEAAAFKQEQGIISDKTEAVRNQAAEPKLQTVNRAEIINQIVKKAEVIVTGANSEMKLQLEPENLGKLTLKVAVERGLITAKFVVESYEVKQALESNFNELKDLLQDKGLDIQNINVSVGQNGKEFDYSRNSELWKDKPGSGGKNIRQAMYNGYLEGEGIAAAKVNPYNVHIGKFDQRA